MNQLEEQLDYLNYLCEGVRVKPRVNIVMSGTSERGFGLCTCSTEKFINFSSYTHHETRAALLSTWMVGYAAYMNDALVHMRHHYSFITLNSHGCDDYQCPSWIVSPGFGAYEGGKTWFDYGLIGDYFEQAILVAKEDCPERTHRNMHWNFARSIDAMKDETAQQCLSAKLGYVFPNEQELYEDELVRRGL